MKRDMDLVRDMLLAIEEGGGWFNDVDDLTLTNREESCVRYHLAILLDAGVVTQGTVKTYGGVGIRQRMTSERPGSYRMTWAGHDFLDAVRDPEVWKRTKDGASKVGGWSFGLLKDIATAYIKSEAKGRLGLDL